MRIMKQSASTFWGTHKGHDIQIDREPKGDPFEGRFYIIVTAESGMCAYDGWAPETVTTMAEAKREALRGACIQ